MPRNKTTLQTMDVGASSGDKHADSASTRAKTPTHTLPVPFREVSVIESMTLGFRMSMFDIYGDKKKDGKAIGGVTSGGGCGSDAIILEWKGKSCYVKGIDLLRTWVATFDPEAAADFPEAP